MFTLNYALSSRRVDDAGMGVWLMCLITCVVVFTLFSSDDQCLYAHNFQQLRSCDSLPQLQMPASGVVKVRKNPFVMALL